MQNAEAIPNPSDQVKHQFALAPILLAALLILRIPFLAGIIVIQGQTPDWVELVFDVGTYLLTVLFLWIERDRLIDYHIGPLALILILAAKPVMPILTFLMGASFAPFSFPKPVSFSYLAISLGFVLALRLSGWQWKRITGVEFRWLLWGSLAGIGVAFLMGIPMAFTLRSSHTLSGISWAGLWLALIRIPQQLGYAAVTEEPVFRGFLWGVLRKKGWKELGILGFQTVLFMLAHAYYFQNMPLMFWISIPFGALALGFLAWLSRTIASSMAAHSMMNAFGFLFGQLIGRWI